MTIKNNIELTIDMNTTFFQKPIKQWPNIEKKAFEEIQNICQRHDGDAEARYGAWEAMIWLSSQPEIQLTDDFKTHSFLNYNNKSFTMITSVKIILISPLPLSLNMLPELMNSVK